MARHYNVDNADIQFLAQRQILVQTYTALVTDDDGRRRGARRHYRDRRRQRRGKGRSRKHHHRRRPGRIVGIQPWMLAANDTDPDTTNNLFVNNIVSSSGGDAIPGTFRRRNTGWIVQLDLVGRHRDQQRSHRDGDQQCNMGHRAYGTGGDDASSSPTAPKRSMAAVAVTSWSAIPAAMS